MNENPITSQKFRIAAHIVASDTTGMSVYDWFSEGLDRTYLSREAAESAANQYYRGPNIGGIECDWDIVDASCPPGWESTS